MFAHIPSHTFRVALLQDIRFPREVTSTASELIREQPLCLSSLLFHAGETVKGLSALCRLTKALIPLFSACERELCS